jgi:hypothetical protein
LIKPSRYDDDGYVIQWVRSGIPSNTLAVVNALADDAARRQVLGPDVPITVSSIDETNTRVDVDRIVADIRSGGGGMVGLVGVQTNQYPRALDLARRFRAANVPVVIGGFHVSGSLAMLPGVTPELQQALDLGVSLYAGEAEGRFDQVLRDAAAGALRPIYHYLDDLPALGGQPVPLLPAARVRRTAGGLGSFDAGRGCPFLCSFCTIINVQGRGSRRRTADDVEQIVRENAAIGINRFFVTDDNFARNDDWEAILDRLIALRAEGLAAKYTLQVDTACHKIPGFIEKAGRAGVNRVYIGLENIDPVNLKLAHKRHNKIGEYRAMLQAWKRARVLTYAGYILGFPSDTRESVLAAIRTIQHELPIDLLEFFLLTPLPGSEDHQRLTREGVVMEPDHNFYDLHHVTTDHPNLSRAELQQLYNDAWDAYYTPEHVARVLRRNAATGYSVGNALFWMMWFYRSVGMEGVHPLESGWLRIKARRDRRPSFPIEPRRAFYPRYAHDLVRGHVQMVRWWWHASRVRAEIKADPNAKAWRDQALEGFDA